MWCGAPHDCDTQVSVMWLLSFYCCDWFSLSNQLLPIFIPISMPQLGEREKKTCLTLTQKVKLFLAEDLWLAQPFLTVFTSKIQWFCFTSYTYCAICTLYMSLRSGCSTLQRVSRMLSHRQLWKLGLVLTRFQDCDISDTRQVHSHKISFYHKSRLWNEVTQWALSQTATCT